MVVGVIELTIDGVKIPQQYIKKIHVKTSRINPPATLELELVKKLGKYEKLYTKNKKVKLAVCYKNRYPLTTIFDGVIKKPNLVQESLKLSCEDYSHLLSQDIRTVTFRNMYDGDIIKRLAGASVDVSNVQNRKYIRRMSFTQSSVRGIIKLLAEKSWSDWFFSGKKLYYGKKYSFTDEKELYQLDVDDPYIVNNALKWHNGISGLRVIVVGKDDKGKTHTGSYGKGKNIRKFHDVQAGKDQVQEDAKKKYKELSFVGYKGTLKLIGEPLLVHSMPVEITEDGTIRIVYIDCLDYTWSVSEGLRQEAKLGEQEKERKKPKKKKGRKRRKKRKKRKKRSYKKRKKKMKNI